MGKYEAVKGDEIDELFVQHLNKADIDLEIKRLGYGQYMFGTKKISVKMLNGKLLIRVGGGQGCMSVDDFIEQYGRREMFKMKGQELEVIFKLKDNLLNANVFNQTNSGQKTFYEKEF